MNQRDTLIDKQAVQKQRWMSCLGLTFVHIGIKYNKIGEVFRLNFSQKVLKPKSIINYPTVCGFVGRFMTELLPNEGSNFNK